jgi:hypothetical protein
MTELLEAIYLSLRAAEPLVELRTVLVNEIQAGTQRDDLRTVLQEVRIHLHADARNESEDILLDAMDLLVGWCAPEEQI